MGGIDVIDPRYRAVLERARLVLGADTRVRSVEPGGSVGAGQADRWSDLDLVVTTYPDHHEEFLSEWSEWLARITPTVFARTPIAPFVINAVTTDGLTLDVVVTAGGAKTSERAATYTVGMLARTTFGDLGDALEYAVAEQLRGLAGPFIRLIQRGEHAFHLWGIGHQLGVLGTVFLAETATSPPERHWTRSLAPEQRAAVEALPPVAANRDHLIAFGLGVAEQVIERARPLFPRYDLDWPAEFASVVAVRLEEELGLDTRAWLY